MTLLLILTNFGKWLGGIVKYWILRIQAIGEALFVEILALGSRLLTLYLVYFGLKYQGLQ